MKKSLDPLFRRDLFKVAYLTTALAGIASIFWLAPTFTTPVLMSVVVAIILSPVVANLERRGLSRGPAIVAIFLAGAFVFALVGTWAIRTSLHEWDSFQSTIPRYFASSLVKLRKLEMNLKDHYPFLQSSNPTDSLLAWGSETGQWFVDHGPLLMSHFVTWFLLIPPLSFFLLNEGPILRRRFFNLVPNRYFESYFLISNDIFHGISNYIRAKLFEATLVGTLTTLGLALVGAPYAIVLGLLAGITNIVPYVGPFLGAIPAVIIASFDSQPSVVYSVAAVFIVANVVDMVVFFPLIVAKLVRLHPVILVVAVAIGQKYYGLVGMLISVPVTTALKVILQEIYYAIYQHRPSRSEISSEYDRPLLKTE